MIVLLGTCAKVTYFDDGSDFNNRYQHFSGVEIMMLVGFGYLMTFLKRYGMGALGLTMLIVVLGLQWGIWIEWFCAKLLYQNNFDRIHLDIETIHIGLILVTSLLISFGAIIGKVNPLQLVIMTILEALFYSINKAILIETIALVDPGGSIQTHLFGAYFGLAVSFALGKPSTTTDNETNHVSEVFSFVGTLFLFIYWPSFNGGELPSNSHAQQRAVINTILSLLAGSVGTFVMSSFLNSSAKFRPVDIQNATLAAGVAIGTACSLDLRPFESMIIGLVAGIVSTFGFARLTPLLEAHIGLHDTCGVHNLHGMPGIIAGVSSIVLIAIKASLGHDMNDVFVYENQALRQLYALLLTLGISIGSGLLTGFVLKLVGPPRGTDNYSDFPYWEVHPWERDENEHHEKDVKDAKGEKIGAHASKEKHGDAVYNKIENGRYSPDDDDVQEFEYEPKNGSVKTKPI
eukprot:gene14709-16872_t